jgi:hypothetical protein
MRKFMHGFIKGSGSLSSLFLEVSIGTGPKPDRIRTLIKRMAKCLQNQKATSTIFI